MTWLLRRRRRGGCSPPSGLHSQPGFRAPAIPGIMMIDVGMMMIDGIMMIGVDDDRWGDDDDRRG